MTDIRIGNGLDVHRFASGETKADGIILGGVNIPHEQHLEAHSDGDVLTHALMDALLGALALGDIGGHFPDSDSRYRGISSLSLLEEVMTLITGKGWQLGNADITVIAQAPKLAPHIQAIRESLAPVLNAGVDQVSVKATTSEELGFTGRKEGIAVIATVLLNRA